MPKLVRRIALLLVVILRPFDFHPAGAAVVSACDEAGLRAALLTGEPVTFGCDGTIVLSEPIVVTASVSLDGGGRDVKLSGGGNVRILQVGPGAVVWLRGLSLQDGFNRGAEGAPGGEGRGGAVLVEQGELHAVDCKFSNNRAMGGAGTDIAPGGVARGGAIFVSDGLVRLTNCSVTLNKVLGGRGGQVLIITDANVGGDAAGAGASARNSDVVLIDSEIAGNVAEGGEAGVAPGSRRGGHARGGGWEQIGGNVGFTRTLFLTNTAVGARPVVTFSSVVPGTDAVGGGLVVETGISVLEDVVFQGNQALGGDSLIQGRGMGAGGAIVNSGTMELRRAVIRSNVAIAGVGDFDGQIAFGGAIYNLGSLSLRECLVQSNTVSNARTPGYRGIPTGGALWNGGTVTLLNSALDANVATNHRSWRVFGGGIYNTGQVICASVTVCRNIASAGIDDRDGFYGEGGDAFGGGIYQSGGLMALTNVTIASNAVVGSWLLGARFGENLNIAGGSLFLRNSIITSSGGGSNCVGVITDGGHNISSDGSCKFTAVGSLNNTDPKVGPVANYGGSTPTLALLYESPALDSGDAAGCPATDQRGRLRPFGSGCDIGAFESSPPYTIFGSVSGSGDLPTGVQVFVDGSSAAVEPRGTYLRSGLAPGAHFIVPASSAAIFFPSNAAVDLGTDRMVNFYWHHSNKVTLEINTPPGTHRFIYVGQTGQVCRLMGSSNLVDWILLKSDVVNSIGMFSHEEPDVGPGRRRFYNLELQDSNLDHGAELPSILIWPRAVRITSPQPDRTTSDYWSLPGGGNRSGRSGW